MQFIKTNPNPKGKKTGDCVVRALTIAESSTWGQVYAELCDIGRQACEMPNNKNVYGEYLARRGWAKQKMPKHANGKRYTVRQLADENADRVLIVETCKHVACVWHGELLDLWDSGGRSVGNYYIK